MTAILPSLNVDAPDTTLSRYFLPYQVRWINHASPMCLAEKSVRIGWTFADALKNVRKRLLHKNGWRFTEGRNLLNPASHGDIAWAGALASHAAEKGSAPVAYARIAPHLRTPDFGRAFRVGEIII